MAFGLNPNSTETEAEFQAAAEAESSGAANAKSSGGGTSKAVKIGVSIGVIVFALLVAGALGAFFIRRRRQVQAAPPYVAAAELDHYAAEHKAYDQAEVKPPVPMKNYELSSTRANDAAPRQELASPPAELAGSRFSENMPEEASTPLQGSFYRD
jgi:hypothetical protein